MSTTVISRGFIAVLAFPIHKDQAAQTSFMDAAWIIALFVCATLLALTGCGRVDTEPTHSIDQCLEREIFISCVRSGADAKECRIAAGALAYRRAAQIKPECNAYP